MVSKSFLKSGHTPTLLTAFLYFDLSFMTWVLLGQLGVAIVKDFGLTPAQKGLMVAAPVLSGAVLRLVAGVGVDHLGPKKTGLALASFQPPSPWAALGLFLFVMAALGAGNGAAFQLAPQRFGKEIGVVTGLVGMTGGVGGFYLASSLGWAKQVTGSYQMGLLAFAALAFIALMGLTRVKTRWRRTWPELAGSAGGLRL